MKRLSLLLLLALTACIGIPEQKLQDGESGCVTAVTMTGSVAMARHRTDNAGKGGSTHGKTRVTCGPATMEIDNSVTGIQTQFIPLPPAQLPAEGQLKAPATPPNFKP